MTESQVVDEWGAEARSEEKISMRREDSLWLLDVIVPAPLADQVIQSIQRQDRLVVRAGWFDVAAPLLTSQQFMDFGNEEARRARLRIGRVCA